jgi:alkylation response protein AidB-like acyl-CoA dehydrogenase
VSENTLSENIASENIAGAGRSASAGREDLAAFQARAASWLADNMPLRAGQEVRRAHDAEEVNRRERSNQRKLFDGGFAGICYPREYGGQGLPFGYQQAFNRVSTAYDIPWALNFPTLSICAPTVLELGTQAQKLDHLPRVLRGEEYICQFFSEPSGGSDLASARTRATRDGDTFVINGSKIWSSSAFVADYGFLLARTNWEIPKHRGLTMFLIKTTLPGITINRIREVDGTGHFCEVFFDDVVIAADTLIGHENGGWAVASAQLAYERTAMGGGSRYASGLGFSRRARHVGASLIELARSTRQLDDTRVRELIGEAHAIAKVQEQLIRRVSDATARGQLPSAASTILRISHAQTEWRTDDIGLEIAGTAGVIGADPPSGPGQYGQAYLRRQAVSIGGGTTEMARNVMSERLLGMPREFAADREVPFSQVRSGR